jgi:GT2 family glycosyltransferase
MAKFSIIIPTYNHCDDLLKPCIESIIKYTTLDKNFLEVIVVPNGCTDNTMQYLSTLNSDIFKIIELKEKSGYTKSTNIGIQNASGEYIILLNNDVELLEQEKDTWIQRLYQSFAEDESIGITGTSFSYLVGEADPFSKFLIFYCVMISRKVINKVGLLDEQFNPGGAEDADYCFRSILNGFKIKNVSEHIRYDAEQGLNVTDFPIWHKAEKTMHDAEHKSGWNEIFYGNIDKLRKKIKDEFYPQYKYILSNSYERHVGGKNDEIPPRKKARYDWAARNIRGSKILEIGCSSGFGSTLLPTDIDYTGLDYDQNIINFARQEFPNRKFVCADINNFDFGYYDTIIAFEVIENLEDGLKILEKLKKHCQVLLITVPYKEEPGFWSMNHKLYKLDESKFQDFKIEYINQHGIIMDKLDDEFASLMIMKWEWKQPDLKYNDVTVEVSTKNRYNTTLPLCLMAVANQSVLPKKIFIFDDGEHKDLRKDQVYKSIFSTFDEKGIEWVVIFGENKGQVLNHQKAIDLSTTDYIWRLDDDNIPEYNVLEKLLEEINRVPEIGAVASLVLHPGSIGRYNTEYETNRIVDISNGFNAQWGKHTDGRILKSAEHLYSTFLFKKEAATHGYNKQLSQIGHREETIFTYEMKLKNWKLLIRTDVITWHYRQSTGGIRENAIAEYWDQDEKIFKQKMIEWGKDWETSKLVILDNGLGDHYAFKHLMDDLLRKYPKVTMAVCYPEVFQEYDGNNIKIISISDAKKSYGNIEEYSIYRWMELRNWTKSILDAYKEMYSI